MQLTKCRLSGELTQILLISRVVHAFTCVGILPCQYHKYSQFAEMGVNGMWYIRSGDLFIHIVFVHNIVFISLYTHSVYNHRGYHDVVSALPEEAMQRAVEEVKALPAYVSEGEVDLSFGH